MSKKIVLLTKEKTKKKDTNTIHTPISHDKQKEELQKYYLKHECNSKKNIDTEINKKINSYKQQDIKKDRLDTNELITKDEVVQLLVGSKLKCYYCSTNVMLFYEYVREQNQWTLDRIDNDLGHNTGNIVISCLSCNLKRRTTNIDKFLFTKKLNIVKT